MITIVLLAFCGDSRFHFIVIDAALCSKRKLNYIRDRRGNYHRYASALYFCALKLLIF
jgi:hypothetical protein